MTDTDRELLAFVIGHRIRSLRQALHLSQGDLAQGIASQSLISLCESGRQLPMPDMLRLIGQRLNDSTLQEYAAALEADDLSFTSTITTNQELLLDALRSLRGRWQEVHEQVAMQLCQYYYTKQQFDIVRNVCRMVFDHSSGVRTYAEACFYYGSSYLFEYDYEQAERWLTLAEQHLCDQDSPLGAKLLYNLGYTYTQRDNQVMALWYARRAVDEFHRKQDLPSYAKALGLLGVIEVRARRYAEGFKSLHLAYDVMTRWDGLQADKARIECSLAAAYLDRLQLEEADTWAQRALATGRESGDDLTVCLTYRNLAILRAKQGQLEESLSYLKQAMETAKHTGIQLSLAETQLLAAGLLPDPAERLAAAREAFQVALETGDHVLTALAAESVANLLAQQSAGSHDTDVDPEIRCEIDRYLKLALTHYRAYVREMSTDYPEMEYLPLRYDV
jgi:tetratricopeptide (TPR) repeat protein